ncbi:MAG TPA: DUF3536 domain-containing protein [bacterium]|nr:DUF3536 domain-containing protein [bacterium]
MSSRFLCIHGHFYQPARENPWLDAVEVQDSAAPHHDWNDRVTSECYARNATSRILDSDERIARIINNYEKISFNVGPTLLRWLARHRHDVYLQILEADAQSRRAHYGHGNAIATIYNHLIMPLASQRDKLTQIRWGIRDFERRFRRRPEGMWLAELAVDLESLELLAAHHVGFTILAPHQAHRVRAFSDGTWTDVTETTLDSTVPYRCRLPSGRSIAIFFYDGPLSRAVAFEGLLNDGAGLSAALVERAATGIPPRIVLVATDGESYGHHHRFGEMALSFAIQQIASRSEVTLTNLGAYLAAHPPVHEVEIRERTSWSCVHGIERWRSDCGCNTGKGYHQRWRGPLREGISWLKDELDAIFDQEGSPFFSDPWTARDEAVDIADREVGAVDGFLGRHLTGEQSPSRRTTALKLLEMQRQGMLMQSSDGWFFDDISGLETVQILAHAKRATELAAGFDASLEDGLLEFLRQAQGNLPPYADGGVAYAALVQPMAVSSERLVALHAIKSNSIPSPRRGEGGEGVYSTRIRDQSRDAASAGSHTLVTGRVQVESMITEETQEAAYALLHFGGHEVHCAVRMGWSTHEYEPVREDLHARFGREILSAIIRRIDDAFGAVYFTLQDLMLEDRRQVLSALTAQTMAQVEEAYRRLFVEHQPLMKYLRDAQADIPAPMLVAAVFVLTRDLERELAASPDKPLSEAAFALVAELQSWGREVRPERFEPLMRRRLEAALSGGGSGRDQLQRALRVLDLADAAGCVLNLWDAQNGFYQLVKNTPPSSSDELRTLGGRLHFNMEKMLSDVRAG